MISRGNLKIAMVTPRFPFKEGGVDGGVQGAVLYLCKGLSQLKNVELHVICPFAPVGISGEYSVYGIKVHALENKKKLSVIFNRPDRVQTFSLIQQISPDIVHFQALPDWAYQCSSPNITTIHGIGERDVLYKGSFITSKMKYITLWYFQGRSRNKIRNVIAISPYIYTFLGKKDGKQIWDIPNPVPDEFFDVYRRPIPGRIFTASHMIPLKNLYTLIKAFALVAKENPLAELRLAGSDQTGEYGIKCRELVRSQGLEKQVRFLGLLPVDEIKKELSQASCFVLPSRQENAPLSIAEAMAVGVPIAASSVGGIPWMVDDNITGKLFNPLDLLDIKNGILSVLAEDKNFEMGEQAKQKAKNLFKQDVVVRKTVNAYLEIIG